MPAGVTDSTPKIALIQPLNLAGNLQGLTNKLETSSHKFYLTSKKSLQHQQYLLVSAPERV